MRRITWTVVALAASIGAATLAHAADKSTPADLTGDWKLNAKRSDAPQAMGGPGMRGERGGPPGMGGGRGMGGPPPGEGGERGARGERGNERGGERGPRMARLPERFHVTHTPSVVSVEDSTGKVLQEVATVTAEADTFARAPGAVHVLGLWDGKTLELKRESPRGGTITEVWKLIDDGRALAVVVHIPGDDRMPERTMKRVYDRVVEP